MRHFRITSAKCAFVGKRTFFSRHISNWRPEQQKTGVSRHSANVTRKPKPTSKPKTKKAQAQTWAQAQTQAQAYTWAKAQAYTWAQAQTHSRHMLTRSSLHVALARWHVSSKTYIVRFRLRVTLAEWREAPVFCCSGRRGCSSKHTGTKFFKSHFSI